MMFTNLSRKPEKSFDIGHSNGGKMQISYNIYSHIGLLQGYKGKRGPLFEIQDGDNSLCQSLLECLSGAAKREKLTEAYQPSLLDRCFLFFIGRRATWVSTSYPVPELEQNINRSRLSFKREVFWVLIELKGWKKRKYCLLVVQQSYQNSTAKISSKREYSWLSMSRNEISDISRGLKTAMRQLDNKE